MAKGHEKNRYKVVAFPETDIRKLREQMEEAGAKQLYFPDQEHAIYFEVKIKDGLQKILNAIARLPGVECMVLASEG